MGTIGPTPTPQVLTSASLACSCRKRDHGIMAWHGWHGWRVTLKQLSCMTLQCSSDPPNAIRDYRFRQGTDYSAASTMISFPRFPHISSQYSLDFHFGGSHGSSGADFAPSRWSHDGSRQGTFWDDYNISFTRNYLRRSTSMGWETTTETVSDR